MINLQFITLASLALSSLTSSTPTSKPPTLPQLALQKTLNDAVPLFGTYTNPINEIKTSTWMKSYPDSTLLVHMNIPGVHDAATWNYTQATQDALNHVTDLNGVTPEQPDVYRCQEEPFIDMLNSGIRVFDFRFAFDATNTSLVFYHGPALQSESATVDDVLFGLYKWLDDHPSEALITSFQYEGGTKEYAADDSTLQLEMYNTLTSPSAQQYFVQTQGELGTLGEARGKITLFRRFDLDQLPTTYEASLPGLHFPPSLWTDNDPDISLLYNPTKNLTAYIEDYYEPIIPLNSPASLAISIKYNATTSHILKATEQYPDSLFWTWASSEVDANVPPIFPRAMATGNGSLTADGGVNQQLEAFLKGVKGKRVGIVMFDFFGTPGGLVEGFLGL